MTAFSRTILLPSPPDDVWAAVLRPALMVHIARPLAVMSLSGGAPWPDEWAPGEHRVDVRLFGFLPVGWQVIGIHLLPEENGVRRAEDRGYSPLIRRWHHVIEVAPAEAGGTRYTDRLDIDAGLLTPFVSLFARTLFAHRQRRLRRLAEAGFDFTRT
ncbi:hypothetical protein [Hyphomonas sp.]|uniref:hypothetical protein n=1 Tax=Hyphomonas sp. TaxID=87 RepID=UPI0039195A5A